MDVFNGLHLAYYNITDKTTESKVDSISMAEMAESRMIVKTRPSYPSNSLTFQIENLAHDKEIRFLNINLVLNGYFEVDLILEDLHRKLYFYC